MADLIDRAALLEELNYWVIDDPIESADKQYNHGIRRAISCVKRASTVAPPDGANRHKFDREEKPDGQS